MAKLSLDTNVLVYAVDAGEGERHRRALVLLQRCASKGGLITQQVLGEFLRVGLHTARLDRDAVRNAATLLGEVCSIAVTPREALFNAFDLAREHRIQFWDAVIITVCRGNGVTMLLTEDLQDGRMFGDLRIVNPFEPANEVLIEVALV